MYWVSDGSLTSTALGRRALIGCMYAAVATGVTYGFSMYSSALKEQFCFSQQQLANLNTIMFSLGPFSPLFGAFARRCGVKGTLLLGGLWVSSAQIVFYLVATQRIHAGDPAKVLLGISMLQYMGIQLISSCAFSTPIMHFQRQRGMAAALVKSFVGLAGAVVSQLYGAHDVTNTITRYAAPIRLSQRAPPRAPQERALSPLLPDLSARAQCSSSACRAPSPRRSTASCSGRASRSAAASSRP
jgi:MFS family permease